MRFKCIYALIHIYCEFVGCAGLSPRSKGSVGFDGVVCVRLVYTMKFVGCFEFKYWCFEFDVGHGEY